MKNKVVALIVLLLGVVMTAGCGETQLLLDDEVKISELRGNGSITSFESTSVEGKKIDESILEKHDVTMIYIWEASDSQSVEALEELQQLYVTLPDNANIVTVCNDAKTELELATDILKSKGCEFDTIILDDEIENQISNYIQTFPTAIFVNAKGELLDLPMEGTPENGRVQGYMDSITTYLSEMEVE